MINFGKLLWWNLLICSLTLKDILNANLVTYIPSPECNTAKSRKKTVKATNKLEAVHFYGITYVFILYY